MAFQTSKSISLRAALASGILLIALGFGGGFLYARHIAGASAGTGEAPAGVDFSPVWKAWGVINSDFVPVVVASSTPLEATSTATEDQLKVWGMITGLADSLNDPYSYFLPPSQNKQFSEDLSGSFQGVGMEIEVKNQILTVVSPLKGSPAEAAGIKPGDQILEIDGVSTQDMSTETAVAKIRGPKGTQVTLTIKRDSWSSPRDIKVTREVINVPTVISTPRSDGIFVIQITTFTANSADLFRDAMRQFVQSGDSKLILDLRGNPGGFLEAAVQIGSWFLPSGDVIVTEDYNGHAQNIVHRSYGYDVFGGKKMAILVDSGSASASEILADALHYYGVGELVGTHTFGKGSVQELVEITPDTSLKLTVARWLGPDGAQIPPEGLSPDAEVNYTDADRAAGKDPQMDKAVELLGGNVNAN